MDYCRAPVYIFTLEMSALLYKSQLTRKKCLYYGYEQADQPSIGSGKASPKFILKVREPACTPQTGGWRQKHIGPSLSNSMDRNTMC